MRVLVVEDEGLLAMEMEEALTDAGFDVVGTAASVDKALTLLHARGVDMAVLDLNLAGAGTAPVAEALRARSIPFLVVSGYQSPTLPGAFADVPFLAKPYTLEAFVAAVRALNHRVKTG